MPQIRKGVFFFDLRCSLHRVVNSYELRSKIGVAAFPRQKLSRKLLILFYFFFLGGCGVIHVLVVKLTFSWAMGVLLGENKLS